MLIIISVVCFLVIFKVLKNLELREWGIHETIWEPVKLRIWMWILIIIGCITPILNLVFLITILVFFFIETQVGDVRFKGGKKIWLDKLIDFLNRKV